MPWTWSGNHEDAADDSWEWTGGGNPTTEEPQYPGDHHGEVQGGVPVSDSSDSSTEDDAFDFDKWVQDQMADFPGEYDDFMSKLDNYNEKFFETGDTIAGIAGDIYGVGDQIGEVGDAASGAAGNIGTAADQIGQSGYDVRGAATDTRGIANTVGGLAQEYRDIAGGEDPRFAAYQEAQFGLQERGADRRRAQTGNYFARRGLGTSSAGLEEQNAIERDLALEQQGLSGSLGLQQLTRQDQARGQALSAYGVQGGLVGQAGSLDAAAGGLFANQASAYGTQVGAYGTTAGIYGAQAGVYGQSVDAYGSSLNAYSAGLTNAQIPLEILLALQQQREQTNT